MDIKTYNINCNSLLRHVQDMVFKVNAQKLDSRL